MRSNTHISNVLEGNNNKDRYDAEVKKILSDKTVLSWILKYTVAEFDGYPVEDIRECIEGEPEVGTQRVYPGHTPEAITGLATEDKVPGEGVVTYDVRFYVITPSEECIKLIVNVEGQKKFHTGYDLVTRSIFYCARMLSAQLDTEFTGENYDDIKKVYSIWICMEVPEEKQYTITAYKMKPEELYGHGGQGYRYDLLESVFVCLGKEEETGRGNKLHGMLSTLFSERLQPEEKEKILETDYNFITSVEVEGGLRQMCNLSDLVEERGIRKGMELGLEQGLEQGIEQGRLEAFLGLVRDGLLELSEAAKRLGMSEEELIKRLG